jgi:hypothetical protein
MIVAGIAGPIYRAVQQWSEARAAAADLESIIGRAADAGAQAVVDRLGEKGLT